MLVEKQINDEAEKAHNYSNMHKVIKLIKRGNKTYNEYLKQLFKLENLCLSFYS